MSDFFTLQICATYFLSTYSFSLRRFAMPRILSVMFELFALCCRSQYGRVICSCVCIFTNFYSVWSHLAPNVAVLFCLLFGFLIENVNTWGEVALDFMLASSIVTNWVLYSNWQVTEFGSKGLGGYCVLLPPHFSRKWPRRDGWVLLASERTFWGGVTHAVQWFDHTLVVCMFGWYLSKGCVRKNKKKSRCQMQVA